MRAANSGGVPKCHYCGACGEGCGTASFFNTGEQRVVPAKRAILGAGCVDSARIELHPFGEVLPRATNRIAVNAGRVDRYGVPVTHIDFDIEEYERKMIEAIYDNVEKILYGMRAEALPCRRDEIDVFGCAVHENGTCRMGNDPQRSMLNGYSQMHEVSNLFAVDGSAFPTASDKNPTLTIMALSWRATDRLAKRILGGDACAQLANAMIGYEPAARA